MVAAAALVTAGCIDFEVHFTVRDDGSGSAEVTMFFDEATVLALAAFGEAPPEEACRELLAESEMEDELGIASEGLDWETELHDDADACGVALSADWTAAESERVLGELAEEGDMALAPLDDGGWRFEMDVSELVGEMGEGATGDEADLFGGLGFALPTVAVSVNLPGDPVEHNATSSTGSEFRWEIDLADAEAAESGAVLFAQTAPVSGGSVAVIVAVVVLVAVGALVVLLLVRRRRGLHAADRVAAELTGADSAAESDVAECGDAAAIDNGEPGGGPDATGNPGAESTPGTDTSSRDER